jgi:hypothetical protein
MPIIYQDALEERTHNLGTLNGLKLVLVSLAGGPPPAAAHLELEFYNANELATILHDINVNHVPPGTIFRIHGGRRVPAGDAVGQVRVTAVAAGGAPETLVLIVEPIGDYSTYTLEAIHPKIDPFLSQVHFKFRPGCFTNNCAPDWTPAPPPQPEPIIDYLAKDYDSFRHTLNTAMAQRVPGWRVTSEADHDQVLIDLFSAAADELSDYQDRVMNEAYLASCRKRVSLARHARLMDYHIHQGNQASSWLAVKVQTTGFTLPERFTVWTGEQKKQKDAVVFATRQTWPTDPLLNRLRLYTWSGAAPSLAAGDTQADLELDTAGPLAAKTVRNLIRNGTIKHLLVQEWKNPLTGRVAGRNPMKRQLLQLLPGIAGAVRRRDPLTNTWFVRVFWREEDKLKFNYAFTSFCGAPLGKVDNISLFHGNLALVHQGDWAKTHFHEPGTTLPGGTAAEKHRHFQRVVRYGQQRAVLCPLPREHVPLAYLPTSPGGEEQPISSLWVSPKPTPGQVEFQAHVEVEISAGGPRETWDEVISLIHSDDSSESGDHFVVETDEHERSVLRFGDGINGRLLPDQAIVHCQYQIGGGTGGNIGSDQLNFFDGATVPEVTECWNPFDVVNGRDPELAEKISRAAPEAYRARQLRAVTLLDYIKRAKELSEVSDAVARYAWTGSWRTVRIAIDPAGTTELKDDARRRVERHLDAVRLIGEDLEIRPPIFVPLDIDVAVCIDPEFWREDVSFVLEQEFSEGYTPDGREGFFHPDRWTFGQPLHASQIAGRIHQVTGVEHIISITLKRRNDPASSASELVEMRFNEILRARNDPNIMEEGYIRFQLQGGRQ